MEDEASEVSLIERSQQPHPWTEADPRVKDYASPLLQTILLDIPQHQEDPIQLTPGLFLRPTFDTTKNFGWIKKKNKVISTAESLHHACFPQFPSAVLLADRRWPSPITDLMEGRSQYWYQKSIVNVADQLRANQRVGHLRQKRNTGFSLHGILRPSHSVHILHSKWNPKFGACFQLLNNTSDHTMTWFFPKYLSQYKQLKLYFQI